MKTLKERILSSIASVEEWDADHYWITDAAVSLVICGLLYFVCFSWAHNEIRTLLSGNRAQLYAATTGAFASLLGFALTAKTMAISAILGKDFAFFTQQHTDSLWSVFNSALRWLGIGTLISLISLVLDRDPKEAKDAAETPVAEVTWLFFMSACTVVVSTIKLFRCIQVLTGIAKLASEFNRSRK